MSNFYAYPEEAVVDKWTKNRLVLEKKLESLVGLEESERRWLIRLVRRERGPRSETQAAQKFIQDFFPQAYKQVAEVIWSVFRHGHTHLFVPKILRGAKEQIRPAVGWVYKAEGNRVGLSVADIESLVIGKGWEHVRQDLGHLMMSSNGYFRVTPHLFFLDLVYAVRKFRNQVEDSTNEKTRHTFSTAYNQWISDVQINRAYAEELIGRIRRLATGT
ncbi:MAG: hypothetical protein ACREI2_15080 [Nitrospiraceae bacterium]